MQALYRLGSVSRGFLEPLCGTFRDILNMAYVIDDLISQRLSSPKTEFIRYLHACLNIKTSLNCNMLRMMRQMLKQQFAISRVLAKGQIQIAYKYCMLLHTLHSFSFKLGEWDPNYENLRMRN